MKNLLIAVILLFTTVVAYTQTDLSDLHAPPSQAEIDAVKAEWATRDYGVYNWQVLHTGTAGGGAFTVEIVSHEVDGNTHYAAVRYPENYDPAGSYPVLVSNHGGASGVNVNALGAFGADCYRSFFVALPSFRSEPLNTGNLTNPTNIIYTSEGAPSEMDGDTDDALSLLTGVLAIPGADADRVGVLGGSRGGGVSHLMACKDDRIARSSVFFGATDHLALPGLQAKMENYVDNGGGLTPPENATYTYGVEPYLNGTLTLAEARLALLRRSALYFIDEMSLPCEVHHGDADPVVVPAHSQLLAAAFADAGITSPDFDYYEYAGELHSLPPSTGANDIRKAFLCELNNIVLPIELTEFQGTCEEKLQYISVEWTALTGESPNRFDLQRSTDGRNWKTITTLDISQSANRLAHFMYEDADFSGGQNFYRLQETDISGAVQYHGSISVICGTDAMSLSPNPTSGSIDIHTETASASARPQRVDIFSVTGRKVLSQSLQSTDGNRIDLSGLSSGTYFCHFYLKGKITVKRVVVQ